MTGAATLRSAGSAALSALFDEGLRSFEVAVSRVPVEVSTYRIGRSTIELRFATSSLSGEFRPALAHLECPDTPAPDLRVAVWSRSASGVPVPPLPMLSSLVRVHHAIYSADDCGISAILDQYYDQLTVLNEPAGRALYALDDEEKVPGWEKAAPFRFLMNSWFVQRGIQMIHGASIARNDRGAILAGPGGSGKSSTALRCLLSGELDYLADDYCLATVAPEPTVFSLYGSAKLLPADLARFPELAASFRPAPREVEGEKPVLFLPSMENLRLRRSAPLSAIYLPRVTDEKRTRIVPVDRGSAWHAIAPSTMSQLLGSSRHNLELIGKVSASVPSFRLDLGRDLREIPAAIAAHLDAL